MIQIRKIREKTYPKKDKDGKVALNKEGKPVFEKYDAPLNPPIEVETLHDLFKRVEDIVSRIPDDDKWNLYYTIGHMPQTSDGKTRRWDHQDVVPFDIDDIHYQNDLPHPKYYEAISEALGIDLSKCVVVATGNGLQVLVKPKNVISERNWFDKNKKYYVALSHKIAEALSKYGLAGSLDTSAFEPNRLFRLPCTLNKKPNRPERIAKIIHRDLVTCDWDLVTASGLPLVDDADTIEEKVIRRLRVDGEAVEGGCDFLKWAKANQPKVSEPLWYAMLSIVGRLPDGSKKAHEYSKNSPQYSPYETESKVDQAVNSSGPRTCDNINKLWGKCSGCPNYKKVTSPILLKGANFIASIDSGFHNYNARGQAFPQYLDLLKYYEKKNSFVNVAKKHFTFDGAKWVSRGDDEIKAFAQENFEPICNNTKATEFHGIVSRTNVERPEFFIETIQKKLNFCNGVLNIDTMEFAKPSTALGFLWNIPFKYDPIAQCPMFEKFMDDFTEGDKEKKMILQEYMGYCISGDEPRAQKFLTLVGEGSNGKSTFIEILQALVGGSDSKAYCALSLGDLSKQFDRTMLMGALFNIMDESETYIDGGVWEKFKNYVTGGTVNAAFKGKDAFQFNNKAKFVMLVNDIPKGANPNKGFYRRFLIVQCTATFEGKKVDRFIKDRIVGEELAGIMNFALRGYHRLVDQGYQFTQSKKVDEALKEYQRDSNGVYDWCEDNLQLEKETTKANWEVINGSGRRVASTSLMRKYFNESAKERGEKEVGEKLFSHRLRTWLKERGYDWDNKRCQFRYEGKSVWALQDVWQKVGDDDVSEPF
jgi:P4 family phage/plasmid primase-like protien